MEFLRLGPFHGPTESRSERPGFINAISKSSRHMYPFVVYHASSESRTYTLYASSEESRQKWKAALEDALGVKGAVMDTNKVIVHMLFLLVTHSSMRIVVRNEFCRDYIFQIKAGVVISLQCVLPWSYHGCCCLLFVHLPVSPIFILHMLIIGQHIMAGTLWEFVLRLAFISVWKAGLVSVRRLFWSHSSNHFADYRKIFQQPIVKHITVLQPFNKLIVLMNDTIWAYSLDVLSRIILGQADRRALDTTAEKLAKADRSGSILFFRAGVVAGRTLGEMLWWSCLVPLIDAVVTLS